MCALIFMYAKHQGRLLNWCEPNKKQYCGQSVRSKVLILAIANQQHYTLSTKNIWMHKLLLNSWVLINPRNFHYSILLVNIQFYKSCTESYLWIASTSMIHCDNISRHKCHGVYLNYPKQPHEQLHTLVTQKPR